MSVSEFRCEGVRPGGNEESRIDEVLVVFEGAISSLNITSAVKYRMIYSFYLIEL